MPHANIIEAIDNEKLDHNGLSAKMRAKYVELRASGLPGNEAAKRAGYPPRIQNAPIKLLENSELRAEMQAALRGKGVTLENVAGRVADGLNANVVALSKHDGVTLTDIADHKTRLKAVESATKLWGLGESSKDAASGSSVKLELSGQLGERFLEYLAREK